MNLGEIGGRLIVIIFIIVCAIIVYVVYQVYSEGEKQEKIDANKKQVADYERKMELECKELRQKFYNSSATREIADYILVGKSESPFKVKIDLEGITAFFSDDSSVNYSYRAHGLPSICSSERIDPPRNEKYDEVLPLYINPQKEFSHALKAMIRERYSSIDYSVIPNYNNSTVYLNRIPTRQF